MVSGVALSLCGLLEWSMGVAKGVTRIGSDKSTNVFLRHGGNDALRDEP